MHSALWTEHVKPPGDTALKQFHDVDHLLLHGIEHEEELEGLVTEDAA